MPKFTVLGGSSIAVPELISALIPHIADEREMQVVLHGRDAHKLELVGRVCKLMASSVEGLTVETTTDLEAALIGADYVLNQVRVGGLDARAYDETFPHRWGIPGEETVGPGGAANALRSVPVVLALARVLERVAPDALLLTFSNPSSVVQRAISTSTRLNVIGLCDAPYTMHKLVAQSLGVGMDEVETQYAGMHHFGWITSAKVNGVEQLPQVLADDSVLKALGLEPEIGRLLGAVPHSYFRYFYHPDRMLKKQQASSQPRAKELQAMEANLLEVYASYDGTQKPEALTKRSVIAGLAFGVPARLAVNLTNNGFIPAVPDDTIIEVTSDIVDGQIVPRTPGILPPDALARLQANAAYEKLLVEAILAKSPETLLRAFLLNPLFPSYDVAKEIVAEVWAHEVL
jgi:6-phospho-beta-glucosidase